MYVGRDISAGIASRYGLDSPRIEFRSVARFSFSIQNNPEAYSVSYTVGTGSFPEVKAAGLWRRSITPSSSEVKERVEIITYCPSGPSWPVLGEIYRYVHKYK
jgi:hypothetical protein